MEPIRTHSYRRSWHLHWITDAEFWIAVTGTWGMFSRQTRHYWFGVPYLLNVRMTVSWGPNE